MPGGVNVSVEIFLRRFASAGAIAGVVVAEDIAVDALAESDKEAGHLAQINSVSVRKKQSKPKRMNKVVFIFL